MDAYDPNAPLSPTALEILTYMFDHPYATDSLEGIVRWWMLERSIETETARVESALAELVARGVVVKVVRPESEARFRASHEPAARARIEELVARRGRSLP